MIVTDEVCLSILALGRITKGTAAVRLWPRVRRGSRGGWRRCHTVESRRVCFTTKFDDPGAQRHIQVIASRSRQVYLASSHHVTTAGSAGIMHVRAIAMSQAQALLDAETESTQAPTLSSSRLPLSTVRRMS
jgi:hypothetical protein